MSKSWFRFPALLVVFLLFLPFLPLIALSCSGCDPGQGKAVPAKEPGLSAREAFAVAWPEAQRWNTDARLCWVTGTLDDGGRSGEWYFTFYRLPGPKGLLPPDRIRVHIAGGKIAGTRNKGIPKFSRPEPSKAGVPWLVDSTEAAGLARERGVVLSGGRNRCVASLYAPQREGEGVYAVHWTWELQTMYGTVMKAKYVIDATTGDFLGLAAPPVPGKVSGDVPGNCRPGEELEIIFRMRQYGEKTTVTGGRAWVRVNDWSKSDLGGEGKVQWSLLKVNLTVRGDAGNKGFPLNFSGTGPDLAPWYFIVDSAGRTYKEDLYLSEKSNRHPPRKLSEIPVQAREGHTLNLAFVLPKEVSGPQLWVQWYGLDGNIETAVIELTGKQP